MSLTYTHCKLGNCNGIVVDPKWLGGNGIHNFIKDMGPPPSPSHSIDRINIEANYSPENCRWADKHQQNANRRNNLPIVGVRKHQGVWRASFTANNKTRSRSFKSMPEAVRYRKQLKNDYYTQDA